MATFLKLAQVADEVSGTSSRLKKRAAIAEGIAAARDTGTPRDAGLFAMYVSGAPFAEADGRKLNIGGAMLNRVIDEIVRPSGEQKNAAWRRHGDLGSMAGDLWSENGHEPAPSLTLRDVEAAFAALATAKTTALRQQTLTGLLRLATSIEAKYLIKLMTGDMRTGAKQSLVEEAIAAASGQPVEAVRHAVMLEADLACAVEMAFEGRLADAKMRLFHPLGFMLASPVASPDEAVERFASIPEAAAEAEVSEAEGTDAAHIRLHAQIEDKFDGMRVQLHFADPAEPGRVALYSRNREDVTASYPEIVEAFAGVSADSLGSRSGVILDGELLAWDVGENRALPFAVLSPRIGRKKVTNDIRVGTPVVYMAFDVLFADGDLLLSLPLQERRRRLEAIWRKAKEQTCAPLEALPPLPSGGLFMADPAGQAGGEQRFYLSHVREAHSATDLDRAYAEARDRGNEGVMIKAADSLYQTGRRGLSWMKLKRHLDTLDVVITGAEWGNGRKSQFLSDYTFAVRGPGWPQTRELLNVGKAYSGVTDAEIAELTEWIQQHTLEDLGHFRTVEPLLVLEVAFNNIMRSDRHASGFALRFPRIVQIRRDKTVDEIDTVERVAEIYESQPDKPAPLP